MKKNLPEGPHRHQGGLLADPAIQGMVDLNTRQTPGGNTISKTIFVDPAQLDQHKAQIQPHSLKCCP